MNERCKVLLELMLRNAGDVVEYTNYISSYDAFVESTMVQKAIVMSLLNIGENANRLPAECIENYPHVPWQQIIRMRHLAAHHYEILDIELIWEIASVSVPELITQLTDILSRSSP